MAGFLTDGGRRTTADGGSADGGWRTMAHGAQTTAARRRLLSGTMAERWQTTAERWRCDAVAWASTTASIGRPTAAFGAGAPRARLFLRSVSEVRKKMGGTAFYTPSPLVPVFSPGLSHQPGLKTFGGRFQLAP
jgi:hypothetical protein